LGCKNLKKKHDLPKKSPMSSALPFKVIALDLVAWAVFCAIVQNKYQ